MAKNREYLANHPDAKAADVVAALKSQRVKVSGAQVYNVKAANGKPKRAKGHKRSEGDTLTALIEAKKLHYSPLDPLPALIAGGACQCGS